MTLKSQLPDKSSPLHLSLDAHPENLKKIRQALSEVFDLAGFSGPDAANISLAVVETCSNIVRHAYQHDYTRQIDIAVWLEKNIFNITITDDGPLFNLSKAKPRDVEEICPGGLGIHLIKEIMDKVEHCRTPEGCNQVRLIKKL